MTELAPTLEATDEERLEQATALVRAYCGWHISPSREETIEVRGHGGHTLLLPSMHVTAVESVTDDTTLLTFEDEFYWSAAGVLTRWGGWGYKIVTVELTHGYDDPPAEVTAVVQAIAQRAIANPGALVSKTVGPFSETYSSSGASGQVSTIGLLASEMSILSRYKIPGVA